MSSSYIVDTEENNKKDDTLIIVVDDDGTISVDQETLQNMIRKLFFFVFNTIKDPIKLKIVSFNFSNKKVRKKKKIVMQI